MNNLLLFLILIFVIINIVQTWLIFTYKLLVRGGLMVGAIEAIEVPLLFYLIIRGGIIGFLSVVVVEVAQWLFIAYTVTKDKNNI